MSSRAVAISHPSRARRALTEQMAGVGAAGIRVIDVAALQARFAPVSARMPDIAVNLPAVASYDVLLPSMGVAA